MEEQNAINQVQITNRLHFTHKYSNLVYQYLLFVIIQRLVADPCLARDNFF